MRIVAGDIVKVIRGDDRNKEGKVLEAFPKEKKIIVEGVNIKYKHKRRSPEYRRGAIIESPYPISISNVMLLCPNCNKPTRVGYTITENDEKLRKCKKCKQIIPYPHKK
jgi:large subunit ribosomal protein L24